MTKPAAAGHGLAAESAAFAPWFHNLHLPDGSQTAPNHALGDFPAFKWGQLAMHLPDDLTGWTALDIGCNAGFYSLELARRGAKVTGIDLDHHFLRQARWAAEMFGLQDRITFRQAQVYELAHWPESFDLVLFMGVFYHLRYPMLGLDIVAEKARHLLVIQSLTMPGEEVVTPPEDQDFDDRSALLEDGWPKMAFVEKDMAGDPTNWWVPNHAGLEAMIRSAGFEVASRPGHEIYVCRPASSETEAWRRNPGELDAACGRFGSR